MVLFDGNGSNEVFNPEFKFHGMYCFNSWNMKGGQSGVSIGPKRGPRAPVS